ncbi:MAG: putative bifunctional diguanylate cyclase/phosphodiesterase [Pontibacterium sp.]
MARSETEQQGNEPLRRRLSEGVKSARWMSQQVRWLSPMATYGLVGLCTFVLLLTLGASLKQHMAVQTLKAEQGAHVAESKLATLTTHLNNAMFGLSAIQHSALPEQELEAFLVLNPAIDRVMLVADNRVVMDSAALLPKYLDNGPWVPETFPFSFFLNQLSQQAAPFTVFEGEVPSSRISGIQKRRVYGFVRLQSGHQDDSQFAIVELSRTYFNDQLQFLSTGSESGSALFTETGGLVALSGAFETDRIAELLAEGAGVAGVVVPAVLADTSHLTFFGTKLLNSNLYFVSQVNDRQLMQSWVHANWLIVMASLLLSFALTILGVMYIRHDRQRQPLIEELRVAAVAFNVHTGMVVTDQQGKVLRVNEAFEQMTGFAAKTIEGQASRILQPDGMGREFRRAALALRLEDCWEGEVTAMRKTGETFPVWLSTKAVRNDRGEVTHYVSSLSDMSERKAAEEEIARLAFYDSLTGLPNRRLFNERLPHVMKTSHRSGQYGALMVIDLDHFKTINDTRGHDVGDALLVEIASRLQGILRDSDTVARMGGDEFVVLLENLGQARSKAEKDVSTVANKILSALAEPIDVKGLRFNVSTSGGMVLFKGVLRSHDEIFKYADIALYEAKGLGRNRFEFFNEAMLVDLSEAVEIAQALEKAIKEDSLTLFLQPQFDKARRMVAAEALVRWPQPDGTQIEPKVMIPIAEKNDLILLLGDWVLNKVCQMVNRLVMAGVDSNFQLSVNISIKQFIQQDFAAQVESILKRNNTDPKFIKLELTENLMLNNIDVATTRMRQLKELGVSIDVDDFGTGFSSLSYLQSLPIDSLKIDGSFLANIGSNAESSAIIHSTILMAQALRLKVVAEGVENQEQLSFLESHDCDLFQGYLLCMPIPSDDFESRMLKQIESDQSL